MTPYGNSKLIAEMMLDEFTRLTPSVSTALLRYFNPVGAHSTAKIGELPRGVPGNLMPFITQTAAGWRQELKVFGADYETRDGTAIRDYIHVVDLAIAHVKALEWLTSQNNTVDYFNLGTGNGQTVMEVIESFERTTGVKLNYVMAPRRDGDIEQIWAVTDKAEQVLGWKATRGLDEMTSSAWKWQQTLDKPE
jgi:UDP-glucose 4-epimerase